MRNKNVNTISVAELLKQPQSHNIKDAPESCMSEVVHDYFMMTT